MRKKRILIGLIVLVIAVLLCALIMKFFSKRNNPGEVVLSTNNGVGYTWKCEIVDKEIATVSKKYTEEVDQYIDGGEVLLHYVIKGKKQGTTKFICDYISSEEEYSVDTSIYLITVDNKLNVRVINSY